MVKAFSVNLAKSITGATILKDYVAPEAPAFDPAFVAEQQRITEELKVQRKLYGEVCQMLQGAANKLNNFYDEMFATHKEEVARLSLEIARKVLLQKVSDGDYAIETIIEEAIGSSPSPNDLVVHLNSEDLASYEKSLEESGGTSFEGVKLVADSSIGKAECKIESPKGTIESRINEQLEKIGKSLVSTV
jgi:flagellar biosynthesis/type III secretory pathway protein FliH